jgi:hypothetical protein
MKTIFTSILFFISFLSFAQLKVDGNGKVIIGNLTSSTSPNCEIGGNVLISRSSIYGNTNLYIKTNNGLPGVDIGTNKNGIAFFLNGKYNMLYASHYYKLSDSILKFNHFDIQSPLDKIQMLQPYYYNTYSIDDSQNVTMNAEYGFFSQEVESTLAEVNITKDIHDGKLLDYDQIIPLLVAAMKEQQMQIDALTQMINSCCNSNLEKNSTTSLLKDEKSGITNLSPNPNNGIFKIDYVIKSDAKKVTFEVIDLNGKVQKTLDAGLNGHNSNSFQMELFGFKPGIYSVKMLVDGISTDTKKIFIQ